MAASTTSRALTCLSRKSRAISISGRESGSPGMFISSNCQEGLLPARATHSVSTPLLSCKAHPVRAGGSDREEFAPHPVHLVVVAGVGEHDGHLDDAVEAGCGRFKHMRHIAQRLPDLLGDRAEIAATA